MQEGNIIELPTGSGLAKKDGVYNIVKHTYTEDEDLRYRYVLRSGDYNDLTIEILPLDLGLHLHNFEFGGFSGMDTEMYPNSLVFNGVAPEYVINKNNVNIVSPNFGEFINNNTFHITYNSHGVDIVNQSVTGNAGESLTVSLPSFKVRVKGVKKNSKISFGAWDNLNGYAAKPIVITEDGTYSIPIRSITVEPTDETFIPEIHIFRLITSLTSEETDQNLDITVEFLPNYEAPTTNMYGDIPDIPLNTVKCMMMDFTPFGDKQSTWYYTCHFEIVGATIYTACDIESDIHVVHVLYDRSYGELRRDMIP